MKRSIFLVLGVITVAGFVVAEEQSGKESFDGKVLLCPDTSVDGKKLVYSYIEGKKTACMPEQKLRVMLGRTTHEKDTTFQREQSDMVQGNDVLVEIQKGRKDLRGLDLSKRDLMKLDLSGTDLRGVNLSGTDLRRANLTNADLRGAKLEGAFLMSTVLNGAKLDSANLGGTYMMKTDLTGVSGLTVDMLKGAVSLYEARMDSVLLAGAKKEFPEKFTAKKDHWKSKMKPEWENPEAKK